MDSIVMVQVNSRNLLAVGYDKDERLLRIAFQNGATYDYYGVPEHVFQELMDAPSLGRYLNAFIRERYTYRRIN